MKNSGIKIVLFVFIVLLVNGIIFFWGRIKLSQKQEVVYGEPIAEFSVTDIEGNKINVNSKSGEWKLIYLSPNMLTVDDLRNARFLEMLYEKTTNEKLLIMGLYMEDVKSLLDYKYKLRLSFHIVCYGSNKHIKKIFNPHRESSTLFMLDPENNLVFVSSFFNRSDIKQLVDKYIKGNMSNSLPEMVNYLEKGQIFPEIPVKNLRTHKHETFPGEKERALAVIFTGRCPDCMISKFKGKSGSFMSVPGWSEVKVSFIFSPGFLEDDVLGNFGDFNSDLFLAIDDIPQVEDYYDSVYLTNEHVLVVELDLGGKILLIDSFDNFIRNKRQLSPREEL